MSEEVKELLQKFVEAIDPENEKINALQKELDDAREIDKKIKEENPLLEEEIKEAKNHQTGLVDLKNAIEELIKNNVEVLEKEGRAEVYHNLVKEEKENYDRYTSKIKEDEDKIAANNKTLESITDTLNFCEDDIKNTKKRIETITSKLEPIFNGTAEENYIEIGKTKELIEALDIYTEEEIQAILKYISFPVPELKGIYEEYQLNKEDNKKTSMKQLFNDANEAADKDKKEEKHQVKKIDKIEQRVEEKKEKYKEIKMERYQDVLNNTFKITAEDIKFNELIEKVSPTKLNEYAKQLIENNIDPASVRMQTLVEDRVDNVIENKKIFAEYGYNLDNVTIADRICDLDSAVPELTRRNLEIVAKSGLSLRNKKTGKIAVEVITREPKKLYQAISLCANVDLNYFEENPNKMDDQVSSRMARILYCQQNGQNYKDGYGNYESFIEVAKEWKSLNGEDIDKKLIPTVKDCNSSLAYDLNDEVIAALNEATQLDNFLKFINLNPDEENNCKLIVDDLLQINTSKDSNVINIGGYSFLAASVYQNIRYLISKGIDINENVLVGCLMFNTHTSPDAIREIKLALDPNTRGLR